VHLGAERLGASHALEAEPVVVRAVLTNERELARPPRAGGKELDGEAEREIERPERVRGLLDEPNEVRQCDGPFGRSCQTVEPVE
jgi:hypothetical protein